jgi:hypothetical protein
MVPMISNNSLGLFKIFFSAVNPCASTISSIPYAHNKQFVEELDSSINSTIARSYNNGAGETFTHKQFLNYLLNTISLHSNSYQTDIITVVNILGSLSGI